MKSSSMIRMDRSKIFLKAVPVIILSMLITIVNVCADQEEIDLSEIQRVTQELVDYGYASNIVVGVLNYDRVEFVSYGKVSLGSNQNVDEKSIFEIGSITKVFTTLILADMVEKGELSLDDPVEKYLPHVNVPSRDGKITLKDLATHTSALPRMPDNFAPHDWGNPYVDYTVEKLYEFLSNYTLPRDIGVEYEYSNLGIGLLGHILTLRSNMTFEELVKNLICKELGLKDTTISLTPEQQVRLAKGHVEDVEIPNWDFDALAGAGALRSSARDLLTFLSAEMGLRETGLYPAMEKTQIPNFALPNSEIGLGWFIFQNDVEIILHDGSTGGYCSYICFDKERKKAVVVLSGISSTGIGKHVENICLHILDPEIRLESPKKTVEVDASTYDDYVGEYEFDFAPGFRITISREGDRLFGQATGQAKFEICPLSKTRFFYKNIEAEIVFLRDENGQVNELILYQEGGEYLAKRYLNY